jgi:hypothetical protein
MKESHGEGVANHTGSESCLDGPRGRGEALTGESTGELLNSENTTIQEPSPCYGDEGDTDCRVKRGAGRPGGVRELGMCGHSLRENRDTSERSLPGFEAIRAEATGKVNNEALRVKSVHWTFNKFPLKNDIFAHLIFNFPCVEQPLNNRPHLRRRTRAVARGEAPASFAIVGHFARPRDSGRIPASLVVRRCAVAARRSPRTAVPAGHSPNFTLPVHASRSQARCDARCRVCVLVLVVAGACTTARGAAPSNSGAGRPHWPPQEIRRATRNRSATITRTTSRCHRQAQERHPQRPTRNDIWGTLRQNTAPPRRPFHRNSLAHSADARRAGCSGCRRRFESDLLWPI